MTATLTAGTAISSPSIPRSPRASAALGQAIYAPIDDHRTAASNSDIGAAWLAAALVGLALVVPLAI